MIEMETTKCQFEHSIAGNRESSSFTIYACVHVLLWEGFHIGCMDWQRGGTNGDLIYAIGQRGRMLRITEEYKYWFSPVAFATKLRFGAHPMKYHLTRYLHVLMRPLTICSESAAVNTAISGVDRVARSRLRTGMGLWLLDKTRWAASGWYKLSSN